MGIGDRSIMRDVVQVASSSSPAMNGKRVVSVGALAIMLVIGIVVLAHSDTGSSNSSEASTPAASSTALYTSERGLPSLKVAALSGFDPFKWSNPSCKSSDMDAEAPSTYNTDECTFQNMRFVESAIAQASFEGAQLMVIPEGFDFRAFPTPDTLEPMMATVGYSMCNDTVKTLAPSQWLMSCSAAKYNIALAGNAFVTLTADTGANPDCDYDTCNNRIQEIVFDNKGVVVARYAKLHTFPSDLKFASPGHELTVTFEMFGRKFGILVCYDGLYPFVSGNYSQLNAYKKQGVDTIVWSGGGPDPFNIFGPPIAKGWDVDIVASTVREEGGPGLSGNVYMARSGDVPVGEVHTEMITPTDYEWPVTIVHATI